MERKPYKVVLKVVCTKVVDVSGAIDPTNAYEMACEELGKELDENGFKDVDFVDDSIEPLGRESEL